MIFLTHISFALLIGLILLKNTAIAGNGTIAGSGSQIVFLAVIIFASMLPDIDTVDSFIGKKAKLISMFLAHRGFFHSITAAILFTIAAFIIANNTYLALAFAVGYLSHLFLDSLTKKGVQWFWPSKKRICGVLRTGRIWDWILLLLFLGLDLIMIL
jgi:inner membrane protein